MYISVHNNGVILTVHLNGTVCAQPLVVTLFVEVLKRAVQTCKRDSTHELQEALIALNFVNLSVR